MASYAHFTMIVERATLREKLEKLIHLPDLQQRLRRIEAALDSSSSNERFERLRWSHTYHFGSFGTPKYKSEDDFFAAVEAGDTIRDGDVTLSIGESDDRFLANEQLYFELGFRSQGREGRWLLPDQLEVRFYPPTRGREGQQDQNAIRPVLGLVLEVLHPIFAFSYIDNSSLADKLLTANSYSPPWQYYWDTLVYGSELTAELSLEHLRATPAFRNIELQGPVVWLSSPRGMNDEAFCYHPTLTMTYGDGALLKLFQKACEEHKGRVVEHLGLKNL
jgi:hypothetical protein